MPAYRAFVSQAIDGDTFETDDGESIRLAGVNTPERGQPGSSDATSYLTSLVEGWYVNVVQVDRDIYGRVIAKVWRSTDKLNINRAVRSYLSS